MSSTFRHVTGVKSVKQGSRRPARRRFSHARARARNTRQPPVARRKIENNRHRTCTRGGGSTLGYAWANPTRDVAPHANHPRPPPNAQFSARDPTRSVHGGDIRPPGVQGRAAILRVADAGRRLVADTGRRDARPGVCAALAVFWLLASTLSRSALSECALSECAGCSERLRCGKYALGVVRMRTRGGASRG